MGNIIQNLRGSVAEHSTYTGKKGVISLVTDNSAGRVPTGEIRIHDESTAGGLPIKLPAGHIIQTKFRLVQTQSQNVSNSNLEAFHDANDSNSKVHYVTIDNLTVGNAVLLHFCVGIEAYGSSSIAMGGLGIFRDTSFLYATDGDAFQNYQGTSSAASKFSTLANILFIDTDFTSTSHTYYLGGRKHTSGNWIRVEAGVKSTFLAQEIQQ